MELSGNNHVPAALTLVNSLHSPLNRRLYGSWRINCLIPVEIEQEFLDCPARSLGIALVNRRVDPWINKSTDFIDNMIIITIKLANSPKRKQDYVDENNFY